MDDSSATVDAIADSLLRIIDIDDESRNEIEKLLTDTERRVDSAKDTADSISVMSEDIQSSILPTIATKTNEMKKIFNALKAMERDIIPALNQDLDHIESLLIEAEDAHARHLKKSSTTVTYIWNQLVNGGVLSSEKSRQMKKASADQPLHSSSDLLDLLQSS